MALNWPTMIRQHPRFQRTAIIFISAVHLTDLDRLKGYEHGAVDYISVPVVPELLRAKVRVFAELHRKTRQLEDLNRELEQRVLERTEELAAKAELLLQLNMRTGRERIRNSTPSCSTAPDIIFSRQGRRLHEITSAIGFMNIRARRRVRRMGLAGWTMCIPTTASEAWRSWMQLRAIGREL